MLWLRNIIRMEKEKRKNEWIDEERGNQDTV